MEQEGRPEQVKLVVVGDSGVGKTSLIICYVTKCFPKEYIPIVFDDYHTTINMGGQPLRLYLCDSAGQTEYDEIRPLNYPQTDAFLICCSVDNKDSFENIVHKWIPELNQHCPNVPRIIVGCKTDLWHSRTDAYLSKSYIEEKVKVHGLQYCQTSALLNDGVTDCLNAAIFHACMHAFKKEVVKHGSGDDKHLKKM